MPGHSTRRPDKRGSVYDRRRRKQWLLDKFGNGRTCKCANCGRTLTFATLTVDCWPIPKHKGGTYRRDNIRPMCQPCQTDQGNGMRWGYDWTQDPDPDLDDDLPDDVEFVTPF